MAEYYYTDLYFNPGEHPFCNLVLDAVSSLLESGCRLKHIVVPTPDSPRDRPGSGVSNHFGVEHILSLCETHLKSVEGEDFVSFPPSWGRIVMDYGFGFDPELEDDIIEEEAETSTAAGDIGLSFRYTVREEYGRKIKLTMSTWYDFVLSKGRPETHARNAGALLSIVDRLCRFSAPYFGAMNTELHIDIDRSLGRFLEGRLPDGNDIVIIGPEYSEKVDTKAIEDSGVPYKVFPSGMTAIQFTDRWGALSAL